MKKWLIMIILVLVVAVLATGCSGQLSNLIQQKPVDTQVSSTQAVTGTDSLDNRSKLSVTTTETVKVVPDVAYITLGVTTQGNSADEAQKANNTTANAVLDAIHQQGITDENIKTSNISVYPDYNDTKKYNVQVDYTIKVSPIDKVGKVIDSAITAGANVTYSLAFDIQDRDTVYMKALEKAMGSVAQKAQQLATAGGLTIDHVLQIDEVNQGYAYPMASQAMVEKAAADTITVAPGEMEISATVTATYLLK